MPSIRIRSLALALAIGLAAPASAGWWPSGTSGADGGNAAAAQAHPARRPATTSTAVPEPADFALFAAGVIGLLLGRRGSRSRRD